MKKKIYWLAVQPTPYNYFLYSVLRESSKFEFKFCYSFKQEKNLPFKYTDMTFSDDYFFRRILGIDFNIIKLAFLSEPLFMVVGWNDITKILFMVVRRLLQMPYYFWTDSIDDELTRKSLRLSFYVKKWLLKGAKLVFTTGDFGVKKMLNSELVSDKSKIVALPFFVALPDNVIARKFNPETEALRLVQLSRLTKGKGLYIAIDAIKILINEGFNVKLNIGGVGADYNALTKYINDHNLCENIQLLGWLDEDSKIEVMNGSHALLHAVDLHDPFPLVVLESLALGLPVIGTLKAGSISDRIKDGSNGIIVKDNPASIANGIKRLFNGNMVEQMSHEARLSSEAWPASKGLQILEESIL